MADNLFTIESPTGENIQIPVAVDEATDVYLQLKTDAQIRKYYDDNGYVIVRNVIPTELCDQARANFEKEVKPYNGYIYRQATANPEKHRFTKNNHMINSILNVQSVNKNLFPNFRIQRRPNYF